jgi:hypothetical protein
MTSASCAISSSAIFGVTEEGGQVQRRPSVGAVVVDAARFLGQQTLDALQFAGRARFEDREAHAARHQQVHYFLLVMIDSG